MNGELKASYPWQASMLAVATICVALSTGGPAFAAVRQWGLSINLYNWPYAYSSALLGVTGAVGLCIRHRLRGRTDRLDSLELVAVGLLGALCLWALISATWSVNTVVTPDRALKLIGGCAFGAWFGRELTIRQQVIVLLVGTHLVVVASVWAHWRDWPGVIDQSGMWLGIFPNRNGLGAVCGLAIIACVAWSVLARSVSRALFATVLVVIDWFMLAESGSSTPLVGLAVGIGIVALVAALRPVARLHPSASTAVALFAVVSVVPLWFLTFAHLDSLTGIFGKDSTFTARSAMWREVRAAIRERPWHGYGYDAFWTDPVLVSGVEVNVGGTVVYAHNSFLEIALGLGWPGFVFLVGAAGIAVAGCFRWAWRTGSAESYLWLVLLAYALAQNAMESGSYLLATSWLLLIAAMFVAWRPGRARNPIEPVTTR